jgi:hypothetical protein
VPGIIISNVFKEKFALTFQTTPRKVQRSGPTQTIEEVADLLGVDIRALDLPGRLGDDLPHGDETAGDQALNGLVAHRAVLGRLSEVEYTGIRDRS